MKKCKEFTYRLIDFKFCLELESPTRNILKLIAVIWETYIFDDSSTFCHELLPFMNRSSAKTPSEDLV